MATKGTKKSAAKAGAPSDKADTNKRQESVAENKAAFLAALKASMGVVTTAREACGISRDTHYRWLKEDAEYKAAVDDINETNVDFAESKLFELINGPKRTVIIGGQPFVVKDPPNITAIMAYLNNKGAERGYGNKLKLSGDSDSPLQVEVTIKE